MKKLSRTLPLFTQKPLRTLSLCCLLLSTSFATHSALAAPTADVAPPSDPKAAPAKPPQVTVKGDAKPATPPASPSKAPEIPAATQQTLPTHTPVTPIPVLPPATPRPVVTPPPRPETYNNTNPSSAPSAATPTQAPEHSATLWKATRGDKTIYLLGSVHLLGTNAYPLPDSIEKAYQESQKVAFEVDIQKMNTPEVSKKLLALASLPASTSIEAILPKNLYEELSTWCSSNQVKVDHVKNFRPWMIATMVMMNDLVRYGLNPKLGLDQHFSDRATREKKPTAFLETAEDQLNIFNDLSQDQQNQFLEESLSQGKKIKEMVRDLIAAWKEGDGDTISDIITEEMDEYPDFNEKFVLQRNKKWIPELLSLAEDHKPLLVVVGVGHLVGDGSVIELLEDKDFDVEQL